MSPGVLPRNPHGTRLPRSSDGYCHPTTERFNHAVVGQREGPCAGARYAVGGAACGRVSPDSLASTVHLDGVGMGGRLLASGVWLGLSDPGMPGTRLLGFFSYRVPNGETPVTLAWLGPALEVSSAKFRGMEWFERGSSCGEMVDLDKSHSPRSGDRCTPDSAQMLS